jgi:hypothetical protein
MLSAMSEQADAVDDALALAARLPGALVAGIFRRYGKPLAGELEAARDPRSTELALEGGARATLGLLRVRTPVDVIANDWFVLERAGEEPLALAGPLFAAALGALALAATKK